MKKLLKWILITVLGVLYVMFILYKTSFMPMNSDGATMLLYAEDILSGNIFLSGWSLSGVTFLTTDLPFFIISVAVFGVSIKAFHLATALMYLFMVLSALMVSLYRTKRKWLSVIIMAAIGLFPTNYLLSNAFVHTAAFAFFFLAVFFARAYIDTKKKAHLIAFTVVTALSVCGDGISLCIITLPALLIFVFGKRDLKGIIATLAGTLLGILFSFAYTQIGGADLNTLQQQAFINPYDLWKNILVYAEYFLRLINAYFFSKSIFSVKTLFFALKIIIAAIGIFAMVRSLKKAALKKAFNASVFFMGASFIIITLVLFVTTINTNITAGRYIGFLPLLLGAVISQEADSVYLKLTKPVKAFLMVILILTALTGLIPSGSGFSPYNTYSELAQFLKDESLTNGVGNFWDASVITGYSEGAVKVRPVMYEDGEIKPRIWFCNKEWYNEPVDFVIVRNAPSKEEAENYNFNGIFHMRLNAGPMFGVDEQSAIKHFGKPLETKTFKNYSVLIYKD